MRGGPSITCDLGMSNASWKRRSRRLSHASRSYASFLLFGDHLYSASNAVRNVRLAMAAQSTLRHGPDEALRALFSRLLDRLRARLRRTPRTLRLLAAVLFALGLVGGSVGSYK